MLWLLKTFSVDYVTKLRSQTELAAVREDILNIFQENRDFEV
jgi:hypothetical protein